MYALNAKRRPVSVDLLDFRENYVRKFDSFVCETQKLDYVVGKSLLLFVNYYAREPS